MAMEAHLFLISGRSNGFDGVGMKNMLIGNCVATQVSAQRVVIDGQIVLIPSRKVLAE